MSLAGMGLAAKSLKPELQLIGVSMEQGPAMHLSIQAGHLVEVEEKPSLADALTGGIPPDNQYSFPLCQRFVDRYQMHLRTTLMVTLQSFETMVQVQF